MSEILRMAIVGTGSKAVEYARSWLQMPGVSIAAAADIDGAARDRFGKLCVQTGHAKPKFFDSIQSLLLNCSHELDAVYVSTPHAFHAECAIAVVSDGLDLLLEKPMVIAVDEAQELIDARERSNSTVVIAYQGSLSPLVRDTRERAASGEFGELLSISGSIWENWAEQYSGQWKQKPEISGGGFMFDTGAHMMNTVSLLAGSDFDRVSAYMNSRGRLVDVVSVVAGRLKGGALVTFNAIGEAPFDYASLILLYFTNATVRIDAWGRWRDIISPDGAVDHDEAEIVDNPLLAFMAIREGRMQNHSSVEHGMRLAKLWDAIKTSAASGGDPVSISDA
ncbi:MAG: Gfo/Idh/MocA family oxidoreductase [Albidovulum sp.]|nr:Gfo/Idh/MocA family oxidoreductase [Albidovulum sp.]